MTFPVSHLKPTPRHKLAAATPHETQVAPSQYLALPSKLSMWWNNVDGDCIAAGEAAAKATTGIFITDDTVKAWATANNDLNGGDIESLLTTMQTAGFSQDGNTYCDGPHTAVDWTVPATLQSAISRGPVKIGVAAAQLQNVPGIGQANGWFATGFTPDQNLDHDTELLGYGPIDWLAQCLGMPPPRNDGPGYALFTWGTVGIIDAPSLLAIVGEAWLRNPTTVTIGTSPPTPDSVATFPKPLSDPDATAPHRWLIERTDMQLCYAQDGHRVGWVTFSDPFAWRFDTQADADRIIESHKLPDVRAKEVEMMPDYTVILPTGAPPKPLRSCSRPRTGSEDLVSAERVRAARDDLLAWMDIVDKHPEDMPEISAKIDAEFRACWEELDAALDERAKERAAKT
jgi:hypothetical protein